MLDPRDRKLFVESLRPPDGYTLDVALGTTYSLDLAALLSVPLAISLYDQLSEDDREPDPFALLAAVRRCIDRVSVFCQAGQIYVPKSQRPLFSYLEKSVFQVKLRSGLFHPKVWILRFISLNAPTLYRVVVASRNLTFDDSWDTLLVLEGELTDRELAFARNHPLADFALALPGLAQRPVPPRVRKNVRVMADELRRVRFIEPPGIEDLRFWPLGLPGYSRDPFTGRIDRLLVISPFGSNEILRQLDGLGHENILFSRSETLAHLDPAVLKRFERVLVMEDNADPAPNETEAPEGAGNDSRGPEVERDVPSGLHAKVYVADAGWKGRLWTGSLNATSPSFQDNIEFVAELVGRKSACGIDTVLGDEDQRTGLWPLAEEYTPAVAAEPVSDEMRLARQLDDVRNAIVSAKPTAVATQIGDSDNFKLVLSASISKLRAALKGGVEVRCRPISIGDPWYASLSIPKSGEATAPVAEFPTLSFVSLTSFFAFSVKGRLGSLERTDSFVLNVPLEGLPPDRDERLLLAILENREQVLRYLIMLLFADDTSVNESTGSSWEPGAWGSTSGFVLPTLFESLLRALQRDPRQLDSVKQLVEDLEKTEEGRQLLPNDFEKIWEPVRKAREELR